MREPLLSQPCPKPFDNTVPDELRELWGDLQGSTDEYWDCIGIPCDNCTLNPDALYQVDTCEDAQGLDIIVRAYMLGFEHGKDEKDDAVRERNNRVAASERVCHAVCMDSMGNKPYNQTGLSLNDPDFGCSECGYPWRHLKLGHNQIDHQIKACPHCGAKVVQEQ